MTSVTDRDCVAILLSFAQFEREVIGERIRDKVAASRKKGMWMGGLLANARHYCGFMWTNNQQRLL